MNPPILTGVPMDDPNLELEALQGLTNPAEVEAVSSTLANLTKETEILLFIGQGCPACPHQVRSVATLALASPKVSAEIVDVAQEPELAGCRRLRYASPARGGADWLELQS